MFLSGPPVDPFTPHIKVIEKKYLEGTFGGPFKDVTTLMPIPSLQTLRNIKHIRMHFEEKNKVKAIVRFRELTGWGLKDSKLFVEYWMEHPELDEQIEEVTMESEIGNKAW